MELIDVDGHSRFLLSESIMIYRKWYKSGIEALCYGQAVLIEAMTTE
jgi:hypothetical protein